MSKRSPRVWLVAIVVVGWVASCASPSRQPVALCAPELPPLPGADCFYDSEGQSYIAQVSEAIGSALSGWRSGDASLSIDFDEDSRVGSLCYAEATSSAVMRSFPRAAARAKRLPPAPAMLRRPPPRLRLGERRPRWSG